MGCKKQTKMWVDDAFHKKLKVKSVRESTSMLELTRGMALDLGESNEAKHTKKKRR